VSAGADGGDVDRDVVVVGGGPAGSSAAVFTARYGLDTLVFDRGNAALQRCAHLENYLGFPAGIDVETFSALAHEHVEEAGAEYVLETVAAVESECEHFLVESQDGRSVTTRYLVAAAWYDGSYLRPLGDAAMFEEHEHHGEREERFDPDYPDADGRTPVDGLYVTAPADDRNAQAVVSAGQGAHVARCLIEDHRRARGYPEGVLAAHYDWLRPESEFAGEWADRDRWREFFENEAGENWDPDDERLVELRERYVDQAFGTRLSEAEVAKRRERGLRRLVQTVGTDRVLDALDDERIREYAVTEGLTAADDD
jgi:hypothetical protein